jgi:hypothetical protein
VLYTHCVGPKLIVYSASIALAYFGFWLAEKV